MPKGYPKNKKPKETKQTSIGDSPLAEKLSDVSLPENVKPKDETPQQTAERLASQPTEEKKTRNYTPRKPKEEPLFSQDSFKPLVTVGLQFLNSRMPNKIDPTEGEVEMVSTALNECLNKYGGTVAEYMPLITLLGSTAMFLVPRIQKPENEFPL